MVKKIIDFLAFLPKELYVFLISMLPIIELRGAVPVGAAIGLPFYLNYLVAVIGNVLPVPFILMFIPKILDLMEKVKIFRPIVKWVRDKADKYKGKIITVKDESCVECGEDGLAVVKELLVAPELRQQALAALARENPADRYEVREPWPGAGERVAFGMIKWLGAVTAGWDSRSAYLGLAFD